MVGNSFSALHPTLLYSDFLYPCVFLLAFSHHFFLTSVCVSCGVLTVAAGVCFIMSRAFLGVFHSCINLARLRGAVCQTVSSAGAERTDG